jgi:hypothetical protein
MEGMSPFFEEKDMSMDANELSLDDLANVSGAFRMPVIPCPKPRPPKYGPHSGASGTSGDGDTQLGSDGGGPASGGSGGYIGDDNYLRAF